MPSHDPLEYDDLVEELRSRPGVQNPHALANHIMARRDDNPGREWREDAPGRLYSTEEAGSDFTLTQVVPKAAWPMSETDGWLWWGLYQEGELVAAWQIEGDAPDAPLRLADEWLALWTAQVGVR